MNDKRLRMLGMAKKAGRVVCGTDNVIASVRSGSAVLVILAQDASAATKKKVTDKCTHYNTPFTFFGTMADVGKAVGKNANACVALTDDGFASILLDS